MAGIFFPKEMDTLSRVFFFVTFTFFFLFLIVPLAVVVFQAFFYNGELSLRNFTDILLDDPANRFLELDISKWGLEKMVTLTQDSPTESPVLRITGINSSYLVNTLFVGVMTTIFSVAIGVTLAFIVARYTFAGKDLSRILMVVPLVVPPFV